MKHHPQNEGQDNYFLRPHPLIRSAEMEVCSRGFPVVGLCSHSRRASQPENPIWLNVAMHSGVQDILEKLRRASTIAGLDWTGLEWTGLKVSETILQLLESGCLLI